MFFLILRKLNTVDINLLTRKLHYAGIRGNILNLIKLYQNDRTKIVRVNGQYSKVNNTSIGVTELHKALS